MAARSDRCMRAERGDLVLRAEEEQDRKDQQPAPAPVPRLEVGEAGTASARAPAPGLTAIARAGTAACAAVAERQALANVPVFRTLPGEVVPHRHTLRPRAAMHEPGDGGIVHHHEGQGHPRGPIKQLHESPRAPSPVCASCGWSSSAPYAASP